MTFSAGALLAWYQIIVVELADSVVTPERPHPVVISLDSTAAHLELGTAAVRR